MRDVEGRVRHRVRVTPHEVTCLDCGEVFSLKIWTACPRCNHNFGGEPMRMTPTVPTVMYLMDGEYEVIA